MCRCKSTRKLAEAEQKIKELTIVVSNYRYALEKLACLGNGASYGNSLGNDIAIHALKAGKSEQSLAKHDADVIRNMLSVKKMRYSMPSCTRCGLNYAITPVFIADEMKQYANKIEAGE